MTAAFAVYILFMTISYQYAEEPVIDAPIECKTINGEPTLTKQ